VNSFEKVFWLLIGAAALTVGAGVVALTMAMS
jgi:hypothetical protein